jgi:hypothetical protein
LSQETKNLLQLFKKKFQKPLFLFFRGMKSPPGSSLIADNIDYVSTFVPASDRLTSHAKETLGNALGSN